ncbi:MAG TPA: S-layer homology domain-containing protein [Syntrophomonadaceae bacterium]|nr:S-layer homology domain-containing protein [Syntrophomonadaceae bacterium]
MRPISKIFADSQNISDWAKSSVDRAVGNGLITGYPDTTFKPQGNATRAEAAVVLSKSILSAVTPPEVKEPVGEDYSLIDKAGTYEPAGGTETVAGDVTIKAKDTTLQNLHLRWRKR